MDNKTLMVWKTKNYSKDLHRSILIMFLVVGIIIKSITNYKLERED